MIRAAIPNQVCPGPDIAGEHYHVPAIAAEAQIAAELTGRRIWTGGDRTKRPWERSKDSWEGGLGIGNEIDNVRSFGPDLIFHEIWRLRQAEKSHPAEGTVGTRRRRRLMVSAGSNS